MQHATGTSTAAAFTTFTEALLTDIYSATCSSLTADLWPGSTAKHAVTAPHASDVSTTSPNAALHTVTAANTTAAANTKTSADTAAAVVHTTAASSSTKCPQFTAAAHTATQPTNITATTVKEHHFLPAVGHVTTHYSHRD